MINFLFKLKNKRIFFVFFALFFVNALLIRHAFAADSSGVMAGKSADISASFSFYSYGNTKQNCESVRSENNLQNDNESDCKNNKKNGETNEISNETNNEKNGVDARFICDITLPESYKIANIPSVLINNDKIEKIGFKKIENAKYRIFFVYKNAAQNIDHNNNDHNININNNNGNDHNIHNVNIDKIKANGGKIKAVITLFVCHKLCEVVKKDVIFSHDKEVFEKNFTEYENCIEKKVDSIDSEQENESVDADDLKIDNQEITFLKVFDKFKRVFSKFIGVSQAMDDQAAKLIQGDNTTNNTQYNATQDAKDQNANTHATTVTKKITTIDTTTVTKINEAINHQTKPSNAENATNNSFIFILFFAFLGGVILNFMPCVLPVLMLKIKSISDKTYSKISTIAGIFFTFFLIAIFIIISQAIGVNIGWGMHFQNVYFLAVMLVVIFVMLLNSLDFFTIAVSLNVKRNKNDAFYDFFSGVIITMLAIPCTAPFLTVAVTYALSANWIEVILIFALIAGGFSVPYFTPQSILNRVSKFTQVSVVFKYVVSICLFATFLWLFWLFANYLSIVQIFLLIALLFGFCLMLKRSKIASYGAIVAVLCIPFFSNGVEEKTKITSDKKIYHKEISKNKVFKNQCVEDVFSKELLLKKINENKKVLVFITANWCITCKVFQNMVLTSKEVIECLKSEDVHVLVGDMTLENEDLLNFIKEYNRSGIPFVAVFYKGNVQVLSEFSFKGELIEAVMKKG